VAAELATGYVSILPSVRGLQRELQRQMIGPAGAAGTRAGREAGTGFAGSFKRSISGLSSGFATIAKGAGLVAGVATAAGGALAAFGIKGAASLEQTQVAFTSLLGSSKAATDQIQQLQKFAAATPFSQQDVFGYAQQYFALANSIGLAKDQVQPFLTTVGNIAAVTGASTENIHNAVLAIGQIGSAGKVTQDNIRQISEAFPGFNANAAIANATGQTTAQVMQEITAGTLDAKTGVQALLVGMQKFPGAANAMAKQSQTLSGLWSTFTDTIQIQLTKAFQPLISTIKTTLDQITPVIASTLQTVAPAISQFVAGLAPILAPLTKGLGQTLAAVFNALGPALAAVSPLIGPLAASFANLVNAVSPLLTEFAQFIAQIGPPLLRVFDQIVAALAPVAQQLAAVLGPVVRNIVQQLAPTLPPLAQAFGKLVIALSPLITALGNVLGPLLPTIAQALTDVANALAPVVQALSGAFADALNAIAPQLPLLVKPFASIAVSLAKILSSLTPIIDLLAQLNAMGLTVMLTGLAKAAQAVADALDGVAGGISSVVSGLNLLGGATVNSSAGLDASTGSALALAAALHGVADASDQLSQRNIANDKQQMASAQAVAKARTQAAKTPGVPGLPNFKTPAVPKPAGPQFDASTLQSFLSTAGINPNPFTAALNSILESAKAAGKQLSSGFVASLRSQNSQLIGLSRQRDKIATQLQNAQQKLADAIQQRNQERDAIKQAVTGTFDLGNIPKPDYGEPITLSGIMRQITQAASNARSFNSVLRRLAKEGLNKGLLQQLAEAGPSALPQARALLTATPKQISQINSQFKTLTQAGTSVGKFVAADMYQAGVDSAKGLVKGLQSQQSALNKAMRGLARTMVAELKNALGIRSPSRVLRQLGVHTGQGFALGIASQERAVKASAALLANGSLPRSQAAAWAAAGGNVRQGDVYVHQEIHNPIPERVSTSSPAGIRRAAYALGR
jgi:tape measure domain-containing protein